MLSASVNQPNTFSINCVYRCKSTLRKRYLNGNSDKDLQQTLEFEQHLTEINKGKTFSV